MKLAMSDSLYAIGVNHLSAPVAMRERLSFAPEALTRALDTLVHSPVAEEIGRAHV